MKYKEDWYANDRLAGTIIRTSKGMPILFDRCWVERGKIFASVKSLVSGKEEVKNMQDLDLTPVPLGYINYRGIASYACRIPKRNDWRQGLRAQNARCLNGLAFDKIPLRALAKTIRGIFPTFDDALEEIGEVSSIAFHRRWAIGTPGNVGQPTRIYYMGEYHVGDIVENKPVLNERFGYLAEALEEAVNA